MRKNKGMPPLDRTAAWIFENVEKGIEVMSGSSDDFVYGRWVHGNPVVRELEEALANLERFNIGKSTYKNGIVYASGMAAINSIFQSYFMGGILQPGDHVIASWPPYTTTVKLINRNLPKLGISVTFVDASDIKSVKNAIIPGKTKMIFVESEANPTLVIADIIGIGELCKKLGILFFVDNSFLSSYYHRPLEFGAHVVVHSVTKFINGHGDVIAGCVIGEEEYLQPLVEDYDVYGARLGPDEAWFVLRSLKTYGLRLMQQGINAQAVAEEMDNHRDKLKEIHYPGLSGDKYHEMAKKILRTPTGEIGYGGMISVETYTRSDAITFLNALQEMSEEFLISVSLGFTETRGEFDSAMVHGACEAPEGFSLPENLVRFSIGTSDNTKKLVSEFRNALRSF